MAVRFDAATDQIERSTAPAIGTSGWTFTAWVYLSVDRDSYSTIMRMHATGSTRANVAADADGQRLAEFTALGSITSSTVMTAGAWHRIAISIQSSGGGNTAAGTLYTADEAGATLSASGTVDARADATGISIGGRGAGDVSEWFNGRVAYARMWTAALAQAEVEAEWASATPARTADLWADWPLTTASDLTDHSGNGRNLTAGTTAVTTEDSPTLSGGGGTDGTATPPVIATTSSVPTPTVINGAAAAPDTITTTATVPAPVVVVTTIAAPTAVETATTTPDPTVTGGATATPPVITTRTAMPAPTVTGGQAVTTGSWWSLLAVMQEAAQYAQQDRTEAPSACPNDGEPLKTGPRGERYCPFCGWRARQ